MTFSSRLPLFLGLVSLAAAPLPLAAETLIVTAARVPQPLGQVGASVSVLTAEDLAAREVSFLDEGLRTLPGLSVSQNGGPGGLSSVRIRGEEAYRTLVLVDGIEIADPAGPQVATNFAPLLTGDVAQVEVVRGPQSLLYGGDAIGGVVQVLTERPEPGLALKARAEGGSFGTAGLSAAALYGGAAFGGALHANWRQADGFSSKTGDPDLGDDDGYETLVLHGRGEAHLFGAATLELVGRYTDSRSEFDGASAFPPFFPADPDRVLETEELAGRLALRVPTSAIGAVHELSVTGHTIARDDLSGGLPFVFGSRFEGERLGAAYLGQFALGEAHRLLVGLDHETIDASTDGFSGDQDTTGLYGEWQGAFADRLYLTAGARFDDNSDFGEHVSGRATAALLAEPLAGETTKLRASIATGFRPPSPFEVSTNLAAALPALKEETAFGFDVGIEQSLLNWRLSLALTYFDQRIEDEIRFDNVGFTGYFQAEGTARSQGLEAEARAKLPAPAFLESLDLASNYTLTESEVNSPDAEDGLQRVRRPRHTGNLSLIAEAGRLQGLLSLRVAADAEDGFREFRVELDDYAVVDAAAHFALTPQAELFVKAVNLFDEEYEEIDGFATSGAAVYAGLRLSSVRKP